MKQYLKPRFFNQTTHQNECEIFWNREAKITQMQAESPYPCMHYYGALKLPINNDFEYYLFMEYIYGDTLDQWYSKRGTENNPMTMRDISMIIKQI